MNVQIFPNGWVGHSLASALLRVCLLVCPLIHSSVSVQAQEGALLRFDASQISVRETAGVLTVSLRSTRPLTTPLLFGVDIVPLEGAAPAALSSLDNQITLQPDQRNMSLTFAITDDADLTGDRRYVVRLYPLSVGENRGVVGTDSTEIYLIDDEGFTSARLEDLTVREDVGQAALALRLDRPAEVAASATIELVADSARADQDFAQQSGVVFFVPGDQEAKFRFNILDDQIFEAQERLFGRVVASDALDVVDFDAEVQIIDNDSPPVLTFGDVQINEGRTQGQVPVRLSQPAGVETGLRYRFASDGAEVGEDFVGLSGAITFPAGVTQQLLSYTLVDDVRDEEPERFFLRFSDPENVTLVEDRLTLTILDDDPPPTLNVEVPRLREGVENQAQFRLSAPSDLTIEFGVRLVPGTADLPDDIAAINNRRLRFAPGETGPKLLTINPSEDDIYEQLETAELLVSDAQNVRVPKDRFTLTVLDANAIPTLQLAEVRAREGEETNGLTFTLSDPSSQVASFSLATRAGSAEVGEDFAAISEVFSFPAGVTEITVPLEIINNTFNEAPEDFDVVLSKADGLQIATGRQTITITDDDPEPSLSLSGATRLLEGSDQGVQLTFTLSQISGRTVNFDLEVTSKIGDLADDLAPFDQAISIPAGSRQIALTIQARDDDLYEGKERFTFRAVSGEGLVLPKEAFEISLIDDDAPPVARLVVPPLQEGEATSIFLQLSKVAGRETRFRLDAFEGTAREGFDYELGEKELILPAGDSSIEVPLTLVDDAVHENPEGFELAILEVEGALLTDNVVPVTVNDNDAFPVLRLLEPHVAEGDGSESLIEFVLSVPADRPTRLSLMLESGSADIGSDLLTQAGLVEFAPGQTRRSFDLQVVDDRAFEGDQDFLLHLISLEGAELDPSLQVPGPESGAETENPPLSSWTITLADNDRAPRLLVTETQVVESAEPGSTLMLFGIDRRAELPVSFSYRLADAEAAAADLVLTPGILVFEPGEIQKTLRLEPVQDALDEDREVYHLLFTDGQSLRLPEVAGRILVLDDDPAPLVTVGNARANEARSSGGTPATLDFPLTLSAPSGRPIQVQVATQMDAEILFAADLSQDIVPLAQTLTFAPGETQKIVQVQIVDDSMDEEVEQLLLALEDADLAQIDNALGRGFIEDNDAPPQVRGDDLAVVESDTQTAALRLRLDQPSGKDVFVSYQLVPDTAEIGSDIEPLQGTAIFLPGQDVLTLPLSLINDEVDEGIETLRLILFDPIDAILAPEPATLTISDDDEGPILRVESPDFQENAPAEEARVTLLLQESSDQDLSLSWQTRPGTAAANQDFVPQSGTLTFKAGERVQTLGITLNDDTIDEAVETFNLLLASDQIRIESATTSLSIIDDDLAPDLRLAAAEVAEGDRVSALRLSLSAPAERDLPGRLAIGEITAVTGQDFALETLDFLIPAGSSSVSVPLQIINDPTDEHDETFDVSAQLTVEDRGSDATARISIIDDDTEPTLTIGDLQLEENASEAGLTLTVSEPSGKPISLTYMPQGGSAQEGLEFAGGAKTLTLPPGTRTTTLLIPLIDDSFDEVDESFRVIITRAAGAEILQGEATVTLRDDDPPVDVSIGAARAQEDGRLLVPLRLDQASGHPVELEVETVSGIAVAGEDYEPRLARVFMEPGELEAEFLIELIDDSFEEQTETFGVRIAGARNAQYDPTPAVMEILDNDQPATLSLTAENMSEGQQGILRFTLASESEDVIVVEYDVADGTADGAADYSLDGGALIFFPGEVEKTISVPLRGDGVDEFDETFLVSILASNAPLATEELVVTILDQDPAPELGIIANSVEEGAAVLPITFTLTALSEKNIEAQVAVTTADSVFAPSFDDQDLRITIPAGQRSADLSIPLRDDNLDEFEEQVRLEVYDLVNAVAEAVVYTTLIEDDDVSSRLILDDRTFAEAEAGEHELRLTLDKPSGKPIDFRYVLADQSAEAGFDWQGRDGAGAAASGQRSIAPGDSEAVIALTILDDDIYEGEEVFGFTLSDLSNVEASETKASYAIVENEPRPSLIVGQVDLSEGGQSALPISLDTASSLPLTLEIIASDGTGALGRDLQPLVDQVTFDPGQTALEVTLTPIDDPFDEFDETIILAYAADLIQVPEQPTILTLVDNDAPPELLFSDMTVEEDTRVTLTFDLSLASNKPLSVDLSALGQTAGADTDFAFPDQVLAFAPGQSQAQVLVTILPDDLDEHAETFAIEFNNPQNLVVPTPALTLTIEDLDPEPQLIFEDLIFSEANPDQSDVRVRLSEPSGREITAVLASADASAQAGEDYAPLLETLTFAPGVTEQVVPLGLIDDALFETSETLILTLGEVRFAEVPKRDALVSILDNDPQPVLSYGDQTLQEANVDRDFVLPFHLDAPAGQPLAFSIVISGQNANAPDIFLENQRIEFAPGQTEVRLTGQIVGDRRDEDKQDVLITLLGQQNLIAPAVPLTLTLIDDDPEPRLTVTAPAVQEGASDRALVQISLDAPSEKIVSARLVTQDRSALAGQDYAPLDQVIVFDPGVRDLQVEVPILDDGIFELGESLSLVLQEVQNARPADLRAELRLADNDIQPQVTVIAEDAVEGQDSLISFTLNNPSSQTITLDYDLQSGSARLGEDFVAQPGSVTIAPGQTSAQTQISISADEIDEATETLTLALTRVVNATAQKVRVPINLLDRNDRPTLAIFSAEAVEDAVAGFLQFTLQLSHPSALPLTLDYATTDLTALAGEDYVPASGQLRLSPGQTQAQLRIDLINDEVFEGPEEVSLRVAYADDPSSAQSASGSIFDDEPRPRLDLKPIIFREGDGSAAILLSLNAPASFPITYAYETVDGSAEGTRDFMPLSGTLRFGAGLLSELVFLDLIDDARREDVERLTLAFTSNLPDAEPEILNIEIRDNDPLPLIQVGSLKVAEDRPGAETPAYVLRLDSPSDQIIRFSYTTVFDGEADAQDVVPLEGIVEIAPGQQEVRLPITLRSDDVAEGDESFTLIFDDAVNVRLSNSRAPITLTETQSPALRFNAPEVEEGSDMIFTLTLSPTSPRPLYFVYGASDGAGGFLGDPSFQLIDAGQSSVTLRLPTQDNAVDEEDRDLTILARVTDDSPLQPLVLTAQGQGRILDNDPDPILIIRATPLTEGQEGALLLTLSGLTTKNKPLTISLDPELSSAIPEVDLPAFRHELTLAQIGDGLRLPLQPIDDQLNEGQETFDLKVDVKGVEVQAAHQTFVIADNDPLPLLEAGDLTLTEGSDLPATLLLSAPSGRDLTLDIAVTGLSATVDTDFVLQRQTLTIPAGTQVVPLPIDIIDDQLHENEERLQLRITRADFVTLANSSFPITLQDDDPTPIVSARLINPQEGQTGLLRLELDTPSAEEAIIALTIQESEAEPFADFNLSDQQIVIPPGQIGVDLPVQFLADGFFEGPETMVLNLQPISGVRTQTQRIEATVLEGDPPPAILLADRAVVEPQRDVILLDVQAFGGFERPLQLGYALFGETATADEDFVASQGEVVIDPTISEAQIELQLIDDLEPEGMETLIIQLSNDQGITLPARAPRIEIIDNEFFTVR